MSHSNIKTLADVLAAIGVNPQDLVARMQTTISTTSWNLMSEEARIYTVLDVFSDICRLRANECRQRRNEERR